MASEEPTQSEEEWHKWFEDGAALENEMRDIRKQMDEISARKKDFK